LHFFLITVYTFHSFHS